MCSLLFTNYKRDHLANAIYTHHIHNDNNSRMTYNVFRAGFAGSVFCFILLAEMCVQRKEEKSNIDFNRDKNFFRKKFPLFECVSLTSPIRNANCSGWIVFIQIELKILIAMTCIQFLLGNDTYMNIPNYIWLRFTFFFIIECELAHMTFPHRL